MTEIITHRGGEPIVSPDTIVICRLRCGAITKPYAASKLRWDHKRMKDDPGDIVAWRHAGKGDI